MSCFNSTLFNFTGPCWILLGIIFIWQTFFGTKFLLLTGAPKDHIFQGDDNPWRKKVGSGRVPYSYHFLFMINMLELYPDALNNSILVSSLKVKVGLVIELQFELVSREKKFNKKVILLSAIPTLLPTSKVQLSISREKRQLLASCF